jgi:hypothetical protein
MSELSNIHESKDAILRLISENFDLMTEVERSVLLNSPKGVLRLLHHKILIGQEDIGLHTKNAIGKEGLFLHRVVRSKSNNMNEDDCKLFSELENWNRILDYLDYIEHNTDLDYSTELLQKICSIFDKVQKDDRKNFGVSQKIVIITY